MSPVGVRQPGDEELHYSDSSHRWIAPNPADDRTWTQRLRADMDEHRTSMDASPARRWATDRQDRSWPDPY